LGENAVVFVINAEEKHLGKVRFFIRPFHWEERIIII